MPGGLLHCCSRMWVAVVQTLSMMKSSLSQMRGCWATSVEALLEWSKAQATTRPRGW
jgi:hypothetical protein